MESVAKSIRPADVKIEKDRIVVYHKQVQKTVAVRFTFRNTALSNLLGTDDWEMDTSKEN